MNWFKQTLANVAGTQEPIYGPDAIQPVSQQAETTPYTESKKEDLRWRAMQSTCIETQTFYLNSENGDQAIVQLLYNNVIGIQTSILFNTKIISADRKPPHVWYSDPVSDYLFDEDMLSLGADNLSVALNEEGRQYTIKSAVNADNLVNLTVTQAAPGFVAGKDGTTYFGTDHANPWGSMQHAFWPRCTVAGTITTKEKTYDFNKGRGFYVHALQGMKPHHGAARWKTVNFQSPTYSAVMIEYTTPPSYGSTVVNVGGIAKDGEIIVAGSSNSATHLETVQDPDNDWPVPKSAKYVWNGKARDDKIIEAVLETSLGDHVDRVDVMVEVPGFIKTIVGNVVGTKPYIYQFAPPQKSSLTLKVGDEEVTEEGELFAEANFICE